MFDFHLLFRIKHFPFLSIQKNFQKNRKSFIKIISFLIKKFTILKKQKKEIIDHSHFLKF